MKKKIIHLRYLVFSISQESKESDPHWRPPLMNLWPWRRAWQALTLRHQAKIGLYSPLREDQASNQPTRGRRMKPKEECKMYGFREPTTSRSGLISRSPSPKKIFSSRIIHIVMPWLYLVLSRDFLSTMSWLIYAMQRILSSEGLLDNYKNQETYCKKLSILCVDSKESK